MCKCTPGIKTPWCGKPGCERPPQQKPASFRPAYASLIEIPDPLALLLYNTTVDYFADHGSHVDDERTVEAAAALLSGFLTELPQPRKSELIEGIYRALKTEHGIP